MYSSSDDNIVNVPISAVKIKVTSIINPYMIRMYETKNYQQKENKLSRTLQQTFTLKKPQVMKKCHLGSMVLTSIDICESSIDLPSWICRGILGHQDQALLKYTVFLVDYGISVKLGWNEFVVISKSKIPNEYLTSTIGLYNIIPTQALLEKHKNYKINTVDDEIVVNVIQEWSERAIKFTTQLISMSSTVMFDPLGVGENEKQFGELYLFIEDSIVRLRDKLVEHLHAIYINNEIEESIINSEEDKESSDFYSFPYSCTTKNNIVNGRNHKGPVTTDTSTENNSETKMKENKEPDSDNHSFSPTINKKLKLLKYKEDGQTVIVHSNMKVKKLNSLESAPFPTSIHKVLQYYNILGVRRIQSYMWPAIMKGAKVVAISSSGTGKTYGHAVAVTSALALNDSIISGNIPSILVLCSSTKEVFEVTELYEKLLMNFNYLHVVSAFNGKDDKSLAAELYNGCQVLISTPPFMARFMDKYKETLISLKRLRYLIFDKADVIFNKYVDSVIKLITKYNILDNKHRIVELLPLQIIAVAQQWTVPLKQFTQKYIEDSYICIDSCMEAAIYTGTKSRAIMISSDKKAERVLSLLGTTDNMLRTMIVCTNDDEVNTLDNYLKSHSKRTIAVHGKINCLIIQEEKKFWNDCISGTFPIFICTDEILSELSINNIDHLIHFSFPPTSKRQFHYRFSTLMDNLMLGNKESKITLLIDESNELQLKSIIDPMQRLGISVPEAWIKSVEYYVAKEDRKKETYQICNKIKAFGFCLNNNFCKYRHCVLNDVDQPVTNIRIGDEITCVVNYIHDASHFSVRIINYSRIDANGVKKTNVFDATNFVLFTKKIQDYYADLKHRRHSKNIAVGNIYASEISIDKFERVQVINIELKDVNEEPLTITIRCVDSGIVITGISRHKLYELPEEFCKIPSHIVEVFLTGIVPFDNEFDWNEKTNSVVDEWFQNYYKTKSTHIYGKVLLHINNTLWIDSLQIRTQVSGYKIVTTSSLKNYLVEKNHAILNENHMDMLIDLCKKGNFDKLK